MHVLYVYPNFTTPRGAWSTRAYDFARRWIDRGHRVTVVTGVYDKSDLRPTGLTWTGVVDGIEVRALNVRLSNRHRFVRRILTFMLLAGFASWHAVRRPYDVALVSSGPLTLGLAGLAARWLRRRPFVVEVRDLFSDGLEQLGIVTNRAAIAGLRRFEGACYRNAACVVALSETMADWIRMRHGIQHVTVVPNAANVELFDRDAVPPEIADGQAAFVFTGTMGRANDCGQLLEAARHLQARAADGIHIYLHRGRTGTSGAGGGGPPRQSGSGPLRPADAEGGVGGLAGRCHGDGPDPQADSGLRHRLAQQAVRRVRRRHPGDPDHKRVDPAGAGRPQLRHHGRHEAADRARRRDADAGTRPPAAGTAWPATPCDLRARSTPSTVWR